MTEPYVSTIDQAIDRLDAFDAVLDARSPAEHAEDHLPGAIAAPVLGDDERARVGTLYKQVSAFAARRVGAALVARNIASILESYCADQSRDWRPLVYCWRGGNRSGALATALSRVGWHTTLLQGGYREYRRRVVADLKSLPTRYRYQVLAGRTGSGKSAVLACLAALGEQVLDLERLARHRGSILGGLPGELQPSQKSFESAIWNTLRRFDTARIVWIESESRKVGQLHLPDALILAMRNSACVVMNAPDTVRTSLLLEEYQHFLADPAALLARLDALVVHDGRARIDEWKAMARAGTWHEFVLAILHGHYDPAYDRSMRRNFQRLDAAHSVVLHSPDAQSIEQLSRSLIRLPTDA
jgi:tRNA 2-selenouridine synthase